MCSKTLCFASFVAAVAVAGSAHAQNLLSNGSFEAPPAGSTFVTRGGPGAMGAWDVLTNIDHIGGFWAAAEGAQSVDMNGSSAGAVVQTIPTIPGRRYRIRFALSENFYGYADKTLNVVWNGVIVDSPVVAHNPARTPTNMLWAYRDVIVTAAASSSTLRLESTTGAMDGSQGVAPFYGPAIDDVSVTLTCDADFNADGFVNSADFFDFLTAFFASDLEADFNADGAVNSQDFFDFLAAFFGGC